MRIWIARNLDGTLELYGEQPIRKVDCFYGTEWIGMVDDYKYPEVTWQNSPKELTVKRNRR